MIGSGLTPTQTLSARRSLGPPALPLPRSASPRKSGIRGVARRSNGADIFSPSKAFQPAETGGHENSQSPTPIRARPRRFAPSPDTRPLQEIVANGEAVTSASTKELETPNDHSANNNGVSDQDVQEDVLDQAPRIGGQDSNPAAKAKPHEFTQDDDYGPNPMGDDEFAEFLSGIDNTIQDASPVPDTVPEAAETAIDKLVGSIEPAKSTVLHHKPGAQDESGRKRKSKEIEEEPAATSSKQPAKKPRTIKADISKAKGKQKVASLLNQDFSTKQAAVRATPQSVPARLPGLTKDTNTHLSQRQQAELNQIIEKVTARPGKLKTLYVLKREKSKKTGAEDIRSGRAVVKPLAYWSAEQCVYDGGAAPGLELGTRIPLSSVREIGCDSSNRKTTRAAGEDSEEDDDDDHEEPWEREIGVFHGQTNVWSQHDQTTMEEQQETVLAFHPSSMLRQPVKDSPGFGFAKLIRNPFFGSGILDLAPGAAKKPKNSRTMHMCFFVFKGRVTVRIGQGLGFEEWERERFSVGKGGVFQVPRGMLLCFPWTFLPFLLCVC